MLSSSQSRQFSHKPEYEKTLRDTDKNKPIHFIGIGGIGMSGIAQLLHDSGYQIRGTDQARNANVERLLKSGIDVKVGHCADHLQDAQLVVISTAVKDGNPELDLAKSRGSEIITRGEMLARIMRTRRCVAVSGTHGKTTTTAMIAGIFESADLDPTVINGGIIQSLGTNVKIGRGDWIVAEADESDGSFLKLSPDIAVITNLDPEHMDFWGDETRLFDAYKSFIASKTENGVCVACLDHPNVANLIARDDVKGVVTYGLDSGAEFQAVQIEQTPNGSYFNVLRNHASPQDLGRFFVPMPGRHNVANALASVAVAAQAGVDMEKIRLGLASFGGVKRRFTKTGTYKGAIVIDDYAHHPVEIRAVLAAAKQAGARSVTAILQPHRYSRLKELFNDFAQCLNDADKILVADVYAAGEKPLANFDSDHLAQSMRANGHKNVVRIPQFENLPDMLPEDLNERDFVIFLGAGSVTEWAYKLPLMQKVA